MVWIISMDAKSSFCDATVPNMLQTPPYSELWYQRRVRGSLQKVMLSNAISVLRSWQPPENWLKFITFECHTAGEPLRIILSGSPEFTTKSILQKRKELKETWDSKRKLLMREPRGHTDMYGAIITGPTSPDSDFGVLFMHNEGYSTMCGHGIIALVTVVLNIGIFPTTKSTLKIDAPAGQISASARRDPVSSKVESVTFYNVPSFCFLGDKTLQVPGVGPIRFDIGFGGAFYAYVDVRQNPILNLELIPKYWSQIINKAQLIKTTIINSINLKHPLEKDLEFLYGVIFVGDAVHIDESNKKDNEIYLKNVCVFADGQIDRSPCGTGVSGLIALEKHKGRITVGQRLVVESIINTIFKVEIARLDKIGEFEAVVPRVEGSAFITGRSEFWVDPDDPLSQGFLL
eukprot:TRINITY_DN7925_c0_g1_i1.p1 TRINITY_DN7925_c0_g1~~TRINITY_DN7925_c0_g1_i1.p1  ORF type:complete len:403 (+),score=68.12 TRINITY_DN7925_c0_g1_i1:479-1687(+)